MSQNDSGGILENTDAIIEEQLGEFKRRAVGNALVKEPQDFLPKILLQNIIIQIEGNLKDAWQEARRSPTFKLGKSAENWREAPPTQVHDKRKQEREVEHGLVGVGKNDPDWTWWNQMPIASGLVGHRADRTRAIDLVCNHKKDRTYYRLVELKLDRRAGTPLAALMEILRYGLVYFVLRKNRNHEFLNGASLNAPIFAASTIDLCVLAPKNYYDGDRLAWLEHGITRALNEIVNDQLNKNKENALKMSLASYYSPSLPATSSELAPDKHRSCLTDWKNAFTL